MLALSQRYPLYRWERNVGYGTPEHWTSVNEHGLSPHHRRTFIHPRQLSLDLEVHVDGESDELSTTLEHLVTDAMLRIPAIVRSEPSENALNSRSPDAP
jgi:hypothetical protein